MTRRYRPPRRLTERHAGSLVSRTIFDGAFKHVSSFSLAHAMPGYVRLAGLRIDVEPYPHVGGVSRPMCSTRNQHSDSRRTTHLTHWQFPDYHRFAVWARFHGCARQVTVPRVLRGGFMRERRLLGELVRTAYDVTRRFLAAQFPGVKRAVPYFVGAVETWGSVVNPHPHVHALCSEGVLDREGQYHALRLCFAMSSRTAGTRSTGTSIAVWVVASNAASSSATASSSLCAS